MAIFDGFFFDDILNNLFYCIILLRYFTCDAHSASKLTESPAIIYFNNTRYTTVTKNYFCKQFHSDFKTSYSNQIPYPHPNSNFIPNPDLRKDQNLNFQIIDNKYCER